MKRSVIITAGGIGKRMGSTIPKQFLLLEDKVVLMHTMNAFYEFDSNIQIVLTLPDDWISYWNELCQKHQFRIDHQIVSGGMERFHSIQNALQHVQADFVAIHDGVRPLVSRETIERCFEAAEQNGNAIPVLAISDSLRHMVAENSSKSVPRKEYVRVQTPQVFDLKRIQHAYLQEYTSEFTDDASVLEATGEQIHLVIGNEENIKITNPLDLKIASVFMQH